MTRVSNHQSEDDRIVDSDDDGLDWEEDLIEQIENKSRSKKPGLKKMRDNEDRYQQKKRARTYE